MAEFVLYNRRCGHVAVIHNDRPTVEAIRGVQQAAGFHDWRIRAGASDEDIASLLRQDGCDGCRVRRDFP